MATHIVRHNAKHRTTHVYPKRLRKRRPKQQLSFDTSVPPLAFALALKESPLLNREVPDRSTFTPCSSKAVERRRRSE